MGERGRVETDWTRDESRGLDVVGPAGASVRRLHRARNGSVTILVLVMGLVFYVLAAMVWNTGQVTSAKIEAQTAADAAAYSSAVWTARAINLTTASNMAQLRHITALEAAAAGIPLTFMPIVEWNKAQAPFCGGPQAVATCAFYWGWVGAVEVPLWISFLFKWGVGSVIALAKSAPKVVEIWRFQRDLIAAVPRAIDAQREALEDYYDCDINLVRGDGNASVAPPLKRGNVLTSGLTPLGWRTYKELVGNSPPKKKPAKKKKKGKQKTPKPPSTSWNYAPELTFMVFGNGVRWWNVGAFGSYALVGLPLINFHHVLTTQYGPLEFGPALLPKGWEQFTVLAAARKRTRNESSLQPPFGALELMAGGVFDGRPNPVAYAQAEAFNGVDGHLPWKLIPLPWRVWTPWGWSWEARLSRGESFSIWPDARGSMLPRVADRLFNGSPHDLGVRASGVGQDLAIH